GGGRLARGGVGSFERGQQGGGRVGAPQPRQHRGDGRGALVVGAGQRGRQRRDATLDVQRQDAHHLVRVAGRGQQVDQRLGGRRAGRRGHEPQRRRPHPLVRI